MSHQGFFSICPARWLRNQQTPRRQIPDDEPISHHRKSRNPEIWYRPGTRSTEFSARSPTSKRVLRHVQKKKNQESILSSLLRTEQKANETNKQLKLEEVRLNELREDKIRKEGIIATLKETLKQILVFNNLPTNQDQLLRGDNKLWL